MTRVLLISRCPPYPLHLGDRLIIWHVARELQQRGYQLDLIAFTQYATDTAEVSAYEHLFERVTLIPEPPRSPTMYLQRLLLPFTRYPQTAQDAWSSELWQAIAQHLEQTQYDIVHVFGGIQVYEVAYLLREQAALITPYESYSLYLKRVVAQQGGLLNRLNQRIAAWFETWMFARYGDIVVLSDTDKAELLRLNSSLTIHVIPNGIDLDSFTPQDTPRDSATLLFVGNYEYPPNLDAALFLAREIFPRIQAEIPDVRLQLVGNAPPPELQALQSDAIDVTGRVPAVQPYLAQATAFVCPLRVGAGIKNKVLEALALGLPVVATPLSIEGITVNHEREILVASPDAIATETIRLLRDPDLQAQLAANGRQVIESAYSWSSVADRYETLYTQIMHG